MLYVNKNPFLLKIIGILTIQITILIKKSFILQFLTFIYSIYNFFNYKYNIRVISGIIAYLISEWFYKFYK